VPQPGPVPSTRHRAAWLALVAALVLVIGGGTAGIIALSHRSGSPAATPVATAIPPPVTSTTLASSRPAVSAVVTTVTVAPPTVRTTPPTRTAPTTQRPATSAPAAPVPVVDFAAIYKKQQSGVIRIETVGCR
jgi:hypothetical protein